MRPPLTERNDEASDGALCRQSSSCTRDEVKAATEKFLLDAISKADERLNLSSRKPIPSLDALFRDLSEISGLCAWHSRKLTRLLSLVRADSCDIKMIQALEQPIADFFSGHFGNDFIVSVKDYAFYSGIKLEDGTENGGIDSDLLHWAEHSAQRFKIIRSRLAAAKSFMGNSTAVEALDATEAYLKEWKGCIYSMRTNKLQDIIRKIAHFIGSAEGPDSDDNQDRMSLGASPKKLESLIDSMLAHIRRMRKELVPFYNVTSSRHERALYVLLDDIRLQAKSSAQGQTNGMGYAVMGQSDLTPYQRAQALELRVKDWVRHEMEFCKFRNEMKRFLKKKLGDEI